MSKNLTKITEEVQEIFDEVLNQTNLDNFITFDLLSDNKLKDGYKIQKTNDVLKFYSQADVILHVNEDIFYDLDDDIKRLMFVEALGGVSYNPENDKLTINQPDFTSHTGVIIKYGFDEVNRMKESIKAVIQQREERKNEEDAA